MKVAVEGKLSFFPGQSITGHFHQMKRPVSTDLLQPTAHQTSYFVSPTSSRWVNGNVGHTAQPLTVSILKLTLNYLKLFFWGENLCADLDQNPPIKRLPLWGVWKTLKKSSKYFRFSFWCCSQVYDQNIFNCHVRRRNSGPNSKPAVAGGNFYDKQGQVKKRQQINFKHNSILKLLATLNEPITTGGAIKGNGGGGIVHGDHWGSGEQ